MYKPTSPNMATEEGAKKSSNIYSALPFSYLTGTSPDQKKPPVSGLKRGFSSEDVRDGDVQIRPRSTSPRDPSLTASNRPLSIDVTDPEADFVGLDPGRSSGAGEEAPRGHHSSRTNGDNVFFGAPEGGRDRLYGENRTNGDGDKRPYQSLGENRGGERERAPYQVLPESRAGSGAVGISNPALDTLTREDERPNSRGSGNPGDPEQRTRLPRLRVAEDGIYQYYKGNPDDPNNRKDANPIWDKYYNDNGQGANPPPGGANGFKNPQGTRPEPANANAYPQHGAGGRGVRPGTKDEDFNTLLRSSAASDLYGGGGGKSRCCRRTVCYVVTAALLAALLGLGAGFAAGWFVRESVGLGPSTTPASVTIRGPVAASTTTTTTTTTTTPVPAITTTTTPVSVPPTVSTTPIPASSSTAVAG